MSMNATCYLQPDMDKLRQSNKRIRVRSRLQLLTIGIKFFEAGKE